MRRIWVAVMGVRVKSMQQGGFADCRAVEALPEDATWIAEWCETGSRRALDRLLRANAGRVGAMARAWSRGTSMQDDLVSEGMLALIGCLGGYAPRKNIAFFAYARPFVQAAMRRTFYRETSIVAVPMHHVRILREGGGSALDRAFFQAATNPERLDAPDAPEIGAECDSGETTLIRTETEGLRGRALEAALATLPERDRLFVERRRAESACSVTDLACRLGVSKAQALKIEARALSRLKTQLIRRGVTSANPEGEA